MIFLIHNKLSCEEEARQHWLQSKTYQMARDKTRDQIWNNAKNGINSNGELTHLHEAGIEIRNTEDEM